MKKEENKSKEVKVEEVKIPQPASIQPRRQIVIETDGNNIEMVKAETSGKIELIGIFQSLIEYLKRSN